jgi:YD repeat-containing protein
MTKKDHANEIQKNNCLTILKTIIFVFFIIVFSTPIFSAYNYQILWHQVGDDTIEVVIPGIYNLRTYCVLQSTDLNSPIQCSNAQGISAVPTTGTYDSGLVSLPCNTKVWIDVYPFGLDKKGNNSADCDPNSVLGVKVQAYARCFGTPTFTFSNTPTFTKTFTYTQTPTKTPTPSNTPTFTQTFTPYPTRDFKVYVTGDYPSDNTPLATAGVVICNTSLTPTPVSSMIMTDGSGMADFGNFAPGNYQVFAGKACFDSKFQNYTLPIAGGNYSTNVNLKVSTIQISGSVKGINNISLVGAQVSFESSKESITAVTDSNGNFSMNVRPINAGTIAKLIASYHQDSKYLDCEDYFDTTNGDTRLSACSGISNENFILSTYSADNQDCCPIGDPVYPSTGMLLVPMQDLKLMGKNGFDFTFTRYYRGDLASYNGPLGLGWTNEYNSSLTIDSAGNVSLFDTDGKIYQFINSNGTFTGPVFLQYYLTISNNKYNLEKRDEKKLFIYNLTNGHLEKVRDIRVNDSANINEITINYLNNNIDNIIDSLGRTIQFVYNNGSDGNGKLAKIYMVSGPELINYGYDLTATKPLLITAQSINGPYLNCVYKYDTFNRIIRKEENRAPKGYPWAEYDYMSKTGSYTILQIRSPLGTTKFTYKDPSGNILMCGPRVTKITDQPKNIVVNLNDSGNTTIIDSFDGSQTQTFGGTGGIKQKTYGIKQRNVTYNAANHLPETMTEDGKTVSYEYYSDGTVKNIIRNVTVSLYPVANAQSITTNFTYDSNGNVLTQTDGEGKVTLYQRDSNANITEIIRDYNGKNIETIYAPYLNAFPQYSETQFINSNNSQVVRTYTWANDGLSFKEELTGIGTINTTTYDIYGRIIQKNSLSGLDTTQYDDLAMTSKTFHEGVSGFNQYFYDNRGKLIKYIGRDMLMTIYEYNDKENLTDTFIKGGVSRIDYTYKQNTNSKFEGLIDTVKDSENKILSYNYDSEANISQTNFDGVTTNFTTNFNGSLVETTSTDAEGKSRINTINENGLILKSKYINDGLEIYNSYDKIGNLKNVIQQKTGNTNTYSYNYDGLGRLKSSFDIDSSSTSMEYDGSNNLISKTQGNNVIEYTFDTFNRPIIIKANDVVQEVLTYNNACPSCGGTGGKLQTETITGYGIIKYDYSTDGSLVHTIYMPNDGPQTTIENIYNDLGQLSQIKLDNNIITEYLYQGTDGWLTGINDKTVSTNGMKYSFVYDNVGHKKEIHYPNNDIMKYEYGTMVASFVKTHFLTI